MDGKTIFSIVRFGNVIGSRGSVYQIFLDQIRRNIPITVTDSRMTRFIMSIQDAAKLILKSTVISKGGEIFILKMPSVKIKDLAESMIEVCGAKQIKYKQKITVSKTRIHERFHEYLVTPNEINYCQDMGSFYKISKAKNKRKVSNDEFSSQTVGKIPKDKLQKVIQELLDDTIDLRKKKKEVIIQMLKDKDYDTIDNDADYKYLLKMSMDSVTEENVQKLTNDHDSKTEQLQDVMATSIQEMWLRELDCLELEYDKFITHRTSERESESGKKKLVKKTKK